MFYVRDVDTDGGLVNNMLNEEGKFIDCFVHYIGRSGDAGQLSYTGEGAVAVDNEHRSIGLKLQSTLAEDKDGNLGLSFKIGGGLKL